MTAGARRPRVLVVDDEQDVVTYLAAALEDQGFEVETAADAAAAEQALGSRRPDLLVLDIMMPGHSGLALFRRLRSDPDTAGLPVVFLSACSAAETVDAMASMAAGNGGSGAVAYFEKPVILPAFLEKARALVRGTGMTEPG